MTAKTLVILVRPCVKGSIKNDVPCQEPKTRLGELVTAQHCGKESGLFASNYPLETMEPKV